MNRDKLIRVRVSKDWAYFIRLYSDPAMYCRISDDFSPWPDELDRVGLMKVPGRQLLKVERRGFTEREDGSYGSEGTHGRRWKPVGLWFLVEVEPGVWDCHTLLTKQCRGRLAIEAGRQALRLMFEKLGAQKLVGRCPECNHAILKFAKRLGFREADRRRDWHAGGKVWHSVYVELEKGEWGDCQLPIANCQLERLEEKEE